MTKLKIRQTLEAGICAAMVSLFFTMVVVPPLGLGFDLRDTLLRVPPATFIATIVIWWIIYDPNQYSIAKAVFSGFTIPTFSMFLYWMTFSPYQFPESVIASIYMTVISLAVVGVLLYPLSFIAIMMLRKSQTSVRRHSDQSADNNQAGD